MFKRERKWKRKDRSGGGWQNTLGRRKGPAGGQGGDAEPAESKGEKSVFVTLPTRDGGRTWPNGAFLLYAHEITREKTETIAPALFREKQLLQFTHLNVKRFGH